MTFDRMRRATATTLWAVYLLFVAVFALHATYFALRFQYRLPHADDWRLFGDLFSHPLLDWLFTAQNGHLVPIPLFLLYSDYRFFLGQMDLLVVTSVLCAWLTLAVFYVAWRGEPRLRSRLGTATFAFGCFLLMWAWSVHDFLWGVNVGTILAIMLFCFSLAMHVMYQVRTREDPAARVNHLLLFAALAAWIAPFCHAMGFVIWPTLIFVQLVARFPFRVVLSFAAATVVTLAAYLLAGRDGGGGGLLDLYLYLLHMHPLYLLNITVSFVGAPVAHIVGNLAELDIQGVYVVALIVGWTGLAGLLLYIGALLANRRKRSPLDSLCLGLMVLPPVTGFLIAMNRYFIWSSGIGFRFIACQTLFWVGAAAALLLFVQRRIPEPGAVVPLILLCVVSVSALPYLQRARVIHAVNRDNLSMKAFMHVLGIQYDAFTHWQPMLRSADTPDHVYQVVERFKKDRRSFFANDWADLPGASIDEHFDEDPSECKGWVQRVQPVEARNQQAAIITGWTVPQSGGVATLFLITDAGGIIRGLGAAKTATRQRSANAGAFSVWTAFVADYRPTIGYEVYSVGPSGRTVCRVASIEGSIPGANP